MTRQTTSQTCLICGDSADSLHFGALSCRACAAFFRRKVAGRRNIFRRCDRQCKVDTGMRKLCASCRYDKCLKVGMRESAVLSRLAKKNQNYKKSIVGSPDAYEPSTSTSDSVLENLQSAYHKLEETRKRVFNISETHVSQCCNYKRMNDVFFEDIKLVMEHLLETFKKSDISQEQEKLLCVHFMVPFILFEGGYKSTNSDLFYLPSGDFIDENRIEEYYSNPDDQNDNSAKSAAEVFRPYWKLNKQTLKTHLDDVQLDLPEFLFITALIYFDDGLLDQNEECIEVCKQMKAKIIEELTDYEKNVRINEDHSYRVGQIIMVLHGIQRTMNMIHETKEISLVYNVYDMHSSIFGNMAE
ncbi:Nuclear hormone receptor family member nhr-42 [Caenorhabditis elegans]|uniref:Nuclear hormone receptor family member nhr-42 n=1 Tax=Caenorhabditis elegans TaxID=6239 RepID=NHR42_CAEEL|nr:Nuclear hormone receptor family member nhr-42 [Caenorhabditis elegans]O76828.1 RecName: Full=Nuclear hormone receptor family member nhr-42 [Caenorhabditis elegans]CCD66530.1 Nuclear hormone receptor family member nhr-42 [Caenorhabditis elegans]|eukprot:NP_504771.1 Nuclear hormone receptor family member nhr-42 [Caenorhabditis elegans]